MGQWDRFSMGRAGIIFVMKRKIGHKCFYFKALLRLMFIGNKKHLVFGSKTLDSRAIK